ncbi:Pyrophosphate-energized vacuolar membrane proton pump 1 [Zea mays]|uniref:Pyrophosphate-energized vacuolar membrane proton pump 1 n=1 Tax=Zea mays TaxID=4577 RepID=A0A1D6G6C0_MAIZE|nr:Pyrophosphate-energized vacuolar membrane proton pump 1 [Zea mays]
MRRRSTSCSPPRCSAAASRAPWSLRPWSWPARCSSRPPRSPSHPRPFAIAGAAWWRRSCSRSRGGVRGNRPGLARRGEACGGAASVTEGGVPRGRLRNSPRRRSRSRGGVCRSVSFPFRPSRRPPLPRAAAARTAAPSATPRGRLPPPLVLLYSVGTGFGDFFSRLCFMVLHGLRGFHILALHWVSSMFWPNQQYMR